MNILKITYNNKDYWLDLFGNEVVKQEKDFFDISQPKTIKNNILKTLKIPKTDNNIEALQYFAVDGSVNEFTTSSPLGTLYIDNIPNIVNAQCFVADKGETYSLILKNGAGNFFDIIKGQRINDLDLSDYDEVWTMSQILADRTNTEGKIFPFFDSGVLSSHLAYLAAQELYPAIFFKTIMDAIFDNSLNSVLGDQDWSYEGDIFTDANFSNKILLCLSQFANDLVRTNSRAAAQKNSTQTADVVDRFIGLLFDNEISDTYDLLQTFVPAVPYDNNATKYVIPSSGIYSFEFVFNYDLSSSGVPNSSIEIIKNASTILHSENLTVAGTGKIFVHIITDLELEKGDYIWCRMDAPVTDTLIMNIISTFEVTNTYFQNTELGLDFPIAENLPDMLQTDFLKEIISMFNLKLDIDVGKRNIVFSKLNELSENLKAHNFDDFTEKLNVKEQPLNTFVFKGLGTRNYFRWAKDNNDKVLIGAGEGYFDLTGNNYKSAKEYVKSLFAYCNQVYLDGTLTAKIQLFVLDDNGNPVITDNELKPRILDVEKLSGSVDISDDDGGSTTTVTTNIPYANPVDFQVLVDSFYSTLSTFADDPDSPELNLLLSVDDFVNFDFLKPKFMKNKGYYFIFHVKEFVQYRASKCLAVKIK